jgi:hypothetical protein
MSKFSRQYPDFAAIEQQIRRAQAERAVYLANWIAEAIVGASRAARRLFARPAPSAAPRRLVVKAQAAR